MNQNSEGWERRSRLLTHHTQRLSYRRCPNTNSANTRTWFATHKFFQALCLEAPLKCIPLEEIRLVRSFAKFLSLLSTQHILLQLHQERRSRFETETCVSPARI